MENNASCAAYKPSLKRSLATWIIAVVCLAGAGGAVILFYRAESGQNDRTAAGILESMTNTVYLLREGSSLWRQAQKGEVLFANDRVKTAPFSDADIRFENGDMVYLWENTDALIMADTDHSANRTRLELSAGMINVSSKSGRLSVIRGIYAADIASGGIAQAAADQDGALILRIIIGRAFFNDGERTRLLTDGSSSGGKDAPAVTVVFPLPTQELQLVPNDPAVFSWTAVFPSSDAAASNSNTVRLEVAEDRAFSHIIYSVIADSTSEGTILLLEEGTYWWRAWAADSESRTPPAPSKAAAGRLKIRLAAP